MFTEGDEAGHHVIASFYPPVLASLALLDTFILPSKSCNVRIAIVVESSDLVTRIQYTLCKLSARMLVQDLPLLPHFLSRLPNPAFAGS
jgi:hypothetical protein